MIKAELVGNQPIKLCSKDSISSLCWSNNDKYLCATSWDNEARIYDISSHSYTPILIVKHSKPLLSSSFLNDYTVATAGGDAILKITDMYTNKSYIIAKVCKFCSVLFIHYYYYYIFSKKRLFQVLFITIPQI